VVEGSPESIEHRDPKIKSLENKNIIRLGEGGSLPENITYKILHQVTNLKKNTVYEISKKFSEVNLKNRQEKQTIKMKNGVESSPKFKLKK
jgi:phospholipid N-methyltransferase